MKNYRASWISSTATLAVLLAASARTPATQAQSEQEILRLVESKITG